MVGAVCGRAQAVGFVAAGACSTSLTEVALANSLGTSAYEARTHARLLAVVTGETSSGYGMRQGADFAALDAAAVAAEATAKAERGRNPQDLEPGEYDVVLEPYAAEDVIGFVAALGLQGRAVLEKTSFATGKLGERLLSEHVTLRDEPFAAAGLIRSFDAEGVSKRPLALVDGGVVAAVTYDSLTAAKAGAQTTGHALPGSSMYGPVATNLSLVPGTQTRDQLIGSIQRGLLVTRFWYTRTVHPLSVTVTGMTRDSTFLIENGRVTRPVKNLRFTMSYVKALQQVIGVGSDAVLAGDAGAPILTPAMAIRGFAFTGKSEY
jgi:predicted Zn-dependent protease